MTTRAYNRLYLSKASRAAGNMLHYAVNEFGINGAEFLKLFIQSGIAEQFENGSPKYIAGKSGLELFQDVMETTTGKTYDVEGITNFGRTPEYWVGWMIVHYQWYSCKSFERILEVVPYDELIGLYKTLHEADIQKSYEVMDAHFTDAECRLAILRKRCGLTQEALAKESGVSVNTIRAYEQKSKDLGRAQLNTVIQLAKALHCEVYDLLD